MAALNKSLVSHRVHDQLCTFRLPRAIKEQIASISQRDFESRSTVIRRLLRAGLQEYASAHRRPTDGGGR